MSNTDPLQYSIRNKLAKSSKFLSPLQADGVLRNFAPSGTDFAITWNPRSKLRGIPTKINPVCSFLNNPTI
jgi:hypothetical protein